MDAVWTVFDLMAQHWLISGVLLLLAVLLAVAVWDIRQPYQTIRHNYPVIGHFRYWLETIGPALRQYIVTDDTAELPFNRSERSWIYASAKGMNNNFGFGTAEQIYGTGYPIIKHVAFPVTEASIDFPPGGDASSVPCLKVMGAFHGRRRLYRPRSIINISGMSYGALGKNAIAALNQGAREAGCYHNTGEGGISQYHKSGADLIWQLGTGYFGACDEQGQFSLAVVRQQVEAHPFVRAIEIKLSQGAKPGKGGILPAAKITQAIAEARRIPMGKDCISPNAHSQFHDVDSLIDFIERLAEATGLPVGIKSAVGEEAFWQELARRMVARRQGPDFITIDGGEGGTGSAPLTFSDHVSLPFKVGFARVYQAFLSEGAADRVVWIGSGKLGFPDRAVIAMAMGCDLINVAREAMMSIGCIQARQCHTGHCPSGISTHNRWLQAGLDVDQKLIRFARYVKAFRKELLDLAHAAGYHHPGQFDGEDVEFSCGVNQFGSLNGLLGYRKLDVPFTRMQDLGDPG